MIKKKIIKFFYLILLISLLASCRKEPLKESSMTENDSVQNKTEIETQGNSNSSNKQALPQYFFLDNKLMGSFINNEWHSLCSTEEDKANATDFYVKDILAQDKYYIFQDRKFVGESNQILWNTQDHGLGSFEIDGVSAKLSKYSEIYNTTEGYSGFDRIFNLPVNIGEELSDLKIPDYSFVTEFVVNDKVQFEYELATNRDIKPFPRKIKDGIEAAAEGIQALKDLFVKNQIENTVPNFTKYMKGDFDNDGNEEHLMFADNPRTESGNPLLCSNGKTEHLGIFNAVLYQDDDGSIQILYSDLRKYKYTFEPDKDNRMELFRTGPELGISIDLLTVADLNSDGVYEIGIKKGEWEHGCCLIYAVNTKGEYEVVMRSNWGM